ncbi:hypothetical protein GIB67_003872 [Kingdonia uniflora]|uniref:C2H2-type domain-containing protein n=1 Tax=Kingdonia uniflora TaxID=39325 RepID=A0A7J7LJS6_9MAGN|nr:hypothetical protein GIB67_003872 [Kingdonia uniflora]
MDISPSNSTRTFLFYFLSLLFMALSTFLPTPKETPKHKHTKQKQKQPSSWDQIKNLLTCKSIEGTSQVHDPSRRNIVGVGYSKLGSSCSSICSVRDVVHGNTRVVHRADNSPESSNVGQETGLLSRKPVNGECSVSSNRAGGGHSNRGMQLRKLSGCYECRMIVDPSRYPMPRSTICACSQCGEVFPQKESLEHHQAVKHAVSELDPDDSGRNIVEIIFKSSWLKKDLPICKIEQILKVHNTQRTIQRFEASRDSVKQRATSHTRKNPPRCAADGNELLRFHCTTLTCTLGSRGCTSLCGSLPGCGVCTVIRNGFSGKAHDYKGVRTMASSGRAHDCLGGTGCRRAMLVCRVIAGRVRRINANDAPGAEEAVLGATYDSVAGCSGVYTNLEELTVFNPRAILPCFVVIYNAI